MNIRHIQSHVPSYPTAVSTYPTVVPSYPMFQVTPWYPTTIFRQLVPQKAAKGVGVLRIIKKNS